MHGYTDRQIVHNDAKNRDLFIRSEIDVFISRFLFSLSLSLSLSCLLPSVSVRPSLVFVARSSSFYLTPRQQRRRRI